MNPKILYEVYLESLKNEGLQVTGAGFVDPPWDQLKPREQIAWGMFCRTLQREFGLHRAEDKPNG